MTPDDAAKITHMTTVPTASPPGSRRVQRCTASNSFSAMPERSSIAPMKMNIGTAARTKFEATASIFWANWKMTAVSKVRYPNTRATPIMEKATWKPEEQCQQQHRKHHQGEIFTHRVPAAPELCPVRRRMHLTSSATPCNASRK